MPPFYDRYTGQPALAGTHSKELEDFTAEKFYSPQLMATSAFGLGRRRYFSPQQCYLNCLRTIKHYMHIQHKQANKTENKKHFSPLKDWTDILLRTLSVSYRAPVLQTVLQGPAAGLSCYGHCWRGRQRAQLGSLGSHWCSNYKHVCNDISLTISSIVYYCTLAEVANSMTICHKMYLNTAKLRQNV